VNICYLLASYKLCDSVQPKQVARTPFSKWFLRAVGSGRQTSVDRVSRKDLSFSFLQVPVLAVATKLYKKFGICKLIRSFYNR
jgi:hypothetical protein